MCSMSKRRCGPWEWTEIQNQLKRIENRIERGGGKTPWDGPTKDVRGLFLQRVQHLLAALNILSIFRHQVAYFGTK